MVNLTKDSYIAMEILQIFCVFVLVSEYFVCLCTVNVPRYYVMLLCGLLAIDSEFRNTGLERSEKLAKDLEWFKEQGHAIPEPSAPGLTYAEYLKELSEKDPQAFLCHFYNIYFAHSAGGRMIGKKV